MDRRKTDALTFSFALPACFCTVFAINAPLLSAMMLPVTSVVECKSPERKKTSEALKLSQLTVRSFAQGRGGNGAPTRMNQTARTEARRDTERATARRPMRPAPMHRWRPYWRMRDGRASPSLASTSTRSITSLRSRWIIACYNLQILY